MKTESEWSRLEKVSFLRQRHLLFSVLLVLLCGLFGSRSAFTFVQDRPGVSILAGDPLDTVAIVSGLRGAPNFVDTFQWWHGKWVYAYSGGVSDRYYRPLTSFFWWIEYKTFGEQGLLGFTAVHVFSHLV